MILNRWKKASMTMTEFITNIKFITDGLALGGLYRQQFRFYLSFDHWSSLAILSCCSLY